MKNSIYKYIIATLAFINLFACKKDSEVFREFNLETSVHYKNQKLILNQIYQWNDYNIEFTTFNLYYSTPIFNFESSEISLSDEFFLIKNNPDLWKLKYSSSNNIKSVTWGLGVNPDRNTQNGASAIDAISYPVSHPLSVSNNMFWSWSPGYIFMKIEGRIDLNQNGNFNDAGETFSLHPGIDANYRIITRTVPSKEEDLYFVKIHLDKILEGFDLSNPANLTVHATSENSSTFPQAQLLMNNLINAIGEIE